MLINKPKGYNLKLVTRLLSTLLLLITIGCGSSSDKQNAYNKNGQIGSDGNFSMPLPVSLKKSTYISNDTKDKLIFTISLIKGTDSKEVVCELTVLDID